MQLSYRPALIAAPIALLLAATMSSTAGAQVATLVGPEGTPEPEPEIAQSEFEFADRQEALLVFAQCMRDNGIEMDDPEVGQGGGRFLRPGGGRGFDEAGETFQVAQQACSPILEASRPDVDPEAQAERLEEQLAMSHCLRETGYEDYPDPVVGADGRLQRFGGRQLQDIGIDPRSEEFQTARAGCAETLGLEFGTAGRGGQGVNQ